MSKRKQSKIAAKPPILVTGFLEGFVSRVRVFDLSTPVPKRKIVVRGDLSTDLKNVGRDLKRAMKKISA